MAIPAPILVVDDEPTIVIMLSSCLRDEGYCVVAAENGERAFAQALEAGPCLVVTDYQMPRCDGLEFARALARDPRTSEIPVIMLTARGHKLLPSELAQTNIRHVVPKPFSARSVLGLVREVLAECGGGDAAVAQERAA